MKAGRWWSASRDRVGAGATELPAMSAGSKVLNAGFLRDDTCPRNDVAKLEDVVCPAATR